MRVNKWELKIQKMRNFDEGNYLLQKQQISQMESFQVDEKDGLGRV